MAVHAESSIQLNTIPAYTSLLGGHFIYRANGTTSTPASANVIHGLGSSFNASNPLTWGYNTHIAADGIKLRYNETDLSTWTNTGLIFYNLGLGNTNNKSIELNSSGLYLYRPLATGESGPQPTAAQLTATGLNITEGSITLGDIDSDNRYPFRVDSEGYLTAREGWIGGIDSYVKLEKDEDTNSHYLNVRLSQLDMLLDGDLYGQENIVDVLDIVAQQSDFIRLWNGEEVWLYYKDGEGTEPYIVHHYIDNDTGEISYYYNENEHDEGQYIKSTDTEVDTGKEYYQLINGEYIVIENPSGNPHSQDYYELKYLEDNWQKYTNSISNLQILFIAGLSQSLKFTDDSLGNQQKLIVSSANNTEDEKTKVEIDPQFLSFSVQSEDNPSLELTMNYNALLDTNSLIINSGEEKIFSIEDSNNYALNTTTGFKVGPLGIFHYKNGLAIGLM